ncbi:hypothetical protein J6590_033551 [Homalodisca vitripennis]|nr:hypothetical protein J6590_033551 [Homalodisca vitripennis]
MRWGFLSTIIHSTYWVNKLLKVQSQSDKSTEASSYVAHAGYPTTYLLHVLGEQTTKSTIAVRQIYRGELVCGARRISDHVRASKNRHQTLTEYPVNLIRLLMKTEGTSTDSSSMLDLEARFHRDAQSKLGSTAAVRNSVTDTAAFMHAQSKLAAQLGGGRLSRQCRGLRRIPCTETAARFHRDAQSKLGSTATVAGDVSRQCRGVRRIPCTKTAARFHRDAQSKLGSTATVAGDMSRQCRGVRRIPCTKTAARFHRDAQSKLGSTATVAGDVSRQCRGVRRIPCTKTAARFHRDAQSKLGSTATVAGDMSRQCRGLRRIPCTKTAARFHRDAQSKLGSTATVAGDMSRQCRGVRRIPCTKTAARFHCDAQSKLGSTGAVAGDVSRQRRGLFEFRAP